MLGQWAMSLLPTVHATIDKINVLVSLPTLPNQVGELHKEAVLSACERAESTILVFAPAGQKHCTFVWR